MSRASCSRPSSASRPSTSSASSRPTSAAASARRSSSTPRRPSAPGRPRRSTGRSSGRRTAPRRSSPTRTAATTSPTPNWRSTPAARSPALRVHTIANLGAYLSTFCVVGADLSLCAAAVGPVQHPGDLLPRSTRSTPTPRRSTPIAAPAVRRRPSSSSASSKWRRARPDAIPPSSAGRTSSPRSRIRRRSSWPMTSATTPAALDKALALADYKGVAGAQGGVGRQGQAARRRLLRLYRGLRHRAVGSGRLARRRRRPVGIGGGAGQSDRHGRGPDRLAQPRPGPRDDLRAAGLRAPRHPDRERLDRPRRHRQGADGHGHLRLALGRGRHVGDLQGARQDRGQGEEGRRPRARGVRAATSSSRTASSPSRAPTSRSTSARSRCSAYVAHKFNGQELEPGPEGERVLGSDELHLPGRRAHLRSRDRPARPAS